MLFYLHITCTFDIMDEQEYQGWSELWLVFIFFILLSIYIVVTHS